MNEWQDSLSLGHLSLNALFDEALFSRSMFLDATFLAVTRTSDIAPDYVAPVQSGGLPWMLIMCGLAVLALISVVYLVMQHPRAPAIQATDDMTLELCRAHGIGMQHRAAIEHIAKLAGVQHTSELFLSEKLFDDAVEKASQVKRLGMRQRGLTFEVRYFLYEASA